MSKDFDLFSKKFADEARRGLAEDGLIPPPEEPPKPSLSTISAVDLQRKDIPPIRWIVKNLLPAGLNILASPPKYGKSWMVLDLCLSVASGGRFMGYQTIHSGTLYLALEDGQRRLKGRMDKILNGGQAPDGFYFATSAHDLDNGLLDQLDGFLKDHPDTGLIVIDTFQKIRGMAHGKESSYAGDYRETASLKAFADRHNVALLLVHHLRKMKDEGDPFNMISGTTGISGAADTMLVLVKEKRDADTANLSVVGRDVESSDMVLSFNKDICRWVNMGDAEVFAEQQARQEYQKDPIVETIKTLLKQSQDGTWSGSSKDLIEAGTYISRTRLALSTQEMSSKLKHLSQLLYEYDGIVHTRPGNGTGGKKHKFSWADLPPLEELDQEELFDPF